MQQCSDNVPPVLDVIVVDGNEINIRYHGTWADLCRNYVKSLPQNVATFQGGNHAILGTGGKDTGRRPSAVAAGQHDVLRDSAGGEGTGQ